MRQRQLEGVYQASNGQEQHNLVVMGVVDCVRFYKYIDLTFLAIDCGRPRAAANGNFTRNIRYNSTITFSCRNGYYIKGIRKANCLSNGLWSNIPPNCIRE